MVKFMVFNLLWACFYVNVEFVKFIIFGLHAVLYVDPR